MIVEGVVAAASRALAADMRRESLQVDVATADVLHAPPDATVYVFRFDAAVGLAVAADIVQWATTVQPPPGLVGVIDAGEQADREELLAAGFDDGVAGPPSAREARGACEGGPSPRPRQRQPWRRGCSFGVVTIDTAGHALWVDGQSRPAHRDQESPWRGRSWRPTAGRTDAGRADRMPAWGGDELEIGERAVDNVVLRHAAKSCRGRRSSRPCAAWGSGSLRRYGLESSASIGLRTRRVGVLATSPR